MSHCNRTRRAPVQVGSRRRGLTLVELIVVVVILTMITAATIPLMAPGTQGRQQREAARLLATMLSSAQTEAIASGRSAGLILERIDGEYRASTTITPCRVPAPYAGDTTDARVTAINGSGPWTADFSNSGQLRNLVKAGDVLMLNNRSTLYHIDSVHTTFDQVTFSKTSTQPPPPPNTPAPGLPYQIFRQPERTGESPVTLPEGSVIDLRWSGFSDEAPFRLLSPPSPTTAQQKLPVVVMFSPTGRLESVRTLQIVSGSVEDTTIPADKAVHFLIGSRERVESTEVDRDAAEEEQPNWRIIENFWVTIQPTTGMVSHAPVAIAPDYTTSALFDADVNNAMNQARAFAGSHRSMGGN